MTTTTKTTATKTTANDVAVLAQRITTIIERGDYNKYALRHDTGVDVGVGDVAAPSRHWIKGLGEVDPGRFDGGTWGMAIHDASHDDDGTTAEIVQAVEQALAAASNYNGDQLLLLGSDDLIEYQSMAGINGAPMEWLLGDAVVLGVYASVA